MEEKPTYEITEPLQNSVEIGETSKGALYVKSVKRYHGGYEEDWRYALKQMFAAYDEARKQINERS